MQQPWVATLYLFPFGLRLIPLLISLSLRRSGSVEILIPSALDRHCFNFLFHIATSGSRTRKYVDEEIRTPKPMVLDH